jgi:hypothetical protein
MATKVDHVLEEALALPADERAKLAAKNLASLPTKPAPCSRCWSNRRSFRSMG